MRPQVLLVPQMPERSHHAGKEPASSSITARSCSSSRHGIALAIRSAVLRRFLRNYGQVLILNAYGGYRLERIFVERSRGSFSCRDGVGQKVRRRMRKTLLIFVGTVTGLALSLITTQPQLLSDGPHAQAAANASYHQLSLFKEVFELVRDNDDPCVHQSISVSSRYESIACSLLSHLK